jgi:hypothetical protein
MNCTYIARGTSWRYLDLFGGRDYMYIYYQTSITMLVLSWANNLGRSISPTGDT